MARITVEDCLEVVPNRFELILLAARRARQLHNGVEPTLENVENDKPTVLALREIAASQVDEKMVAKIDEEEKARRERDALGWVAMEALAGEAADAPSED